MIAASAKQLSFIERLLSEREFPSPDRQAEVYAVAEDPDLSNRDASSLITTLLALPKKAAPSSGDPVTEPGLYMRDGMVYKVQQSKIGRLYAKALVGTSFTYEVGAIARLRGSDLMSKEDAAAYGRTTGVCCVCGRLLTDEGSVAAGIGPVCAARF